LTSQMSNISAGDSSSSDDEGRSRRCRQQQQLPDMEKFSAQLTKYCRRVLTCLPSHCSGYDQNRLVFAWFAISTMDMLDRTQELNRQEIIDWVYSLQILPSSGRPVANCGFRGAPLLGSPADPHLDAENPLPYDASHLTMVFAGLGILLMLGDDLQRVDRDAVLSGVAALQTPAGCFTAGKFAPESDLRFVFSACVSCYYLNDFTKIDVDRSVAFLLACQTYEGGFGQRPGSEAHGGSTFCAIASLKLLGRLDSALPADSRQRSRLLRWLCQRQHRGFHGRPYKDDDSCYTFWIGASLAALGRANLIDRSALVEFVFSCYSGMEGGFSKYPGDSADPLHTYLALAGLAALRLEDERLEPIRPEANITERAHLHMLALHRAAAASAASH
ncbi:hypothetical protein BOX15_Mlig033671g2, partial [Macrostomum lignano]